MKNLVDDWRVVSRDPHYMGGPCELTLEFSNTLSKMRVTLSQGDIELSQEVGPLVCRGQIPPQGLAQGLIDRQLRLGREEQGHISMTAAALLMQMKQEHGICAFH